MTKGESGLRKLTFEYLFNAHPNVKGRVIAGYLEWMYGGYGGELLYMPDNKNWAIGAETYWVRQREYEQKFGFQDYETVTGFISYYQDLPIYDLRLMIKAGKFLGEDKGLLVNVSRRFRTGATVGAAFALTDCDEYCFGEGSFNKWIFFTLPVDILTTGSTTRAKTSFAWAPLTKDGGQQVGAGSLYGLMVSAKDEVDPLRRKSWTKDDPNFFKRVFSLGRDSSDRIEFKDGDYFTDVEFTDENGSEPRESRSISLKKVFSGFGTKPKQKL
jgi:hypothetical protein